MVAHFLADGLEIRFRRTGSGEGGEEEILSKESVCKVEDKGKGKELTKLFSMEGEETFGLAVEEEEMAGEEEVEEETCSEEETSGSIESEGKEDKEEGVTSEE
jgi:hypothetical protein